MRHWLVRFFLQETDRDLIFLRDLDKCLKSLQKSFSFLARSEAEKEHMISALFYESTILYTK